MKPLREGTPRYLNAKQLRFVDEYLIDNNGTAAAIRAGYSPKTARQIAAENLSKPNIAAAIEIARRERSERCCIEADAVVRELAKIAFANIGDYGRITQDGGFAIDLSETNREQFAAISEITYRSIERTAGGDEVTIETRLKLRDKHAALVSLAKHLGMFKEQLDHRPSVTFIIERTSRSRPGE
jgi:phage terminase small subunit